MWFLGAGASAAAGIPTAYHMIWEFKRAIFCSTQRVPLSACADLSNPLVRSRIQAYFSSQPDTPIDNAPDEYGHFFALAYPSEADRRKYIEQMLATAKPSYGHLMLAALLKMDKARAIWTTNFDRMVEDASAQLFGNSSRLVVATTDTPQLAREAFTEGRWPMCVKLHGDFQSRRLKNTTDELRLQDANLRESLLLACHTHGLAVVGYSGRDSSIMESIEEAIDGGRGFPSGLFWFHRPEAECLDGVRDLLAKAAVAGIDAHLIESQTFDELMADVISLMPNIPAEVTAFLDMRPRRLSHAPIPGTSGAWPIVRLNALPIISAPSVCRRVVCDIQGYKDVQQAIHDTDAQVVAGRRNIGVIAFGDDAEIRKAFQAFTISEMSIHAIEPRRLRYESAELGLLYAALSLAIAKDCPVDVHRGSRRTIVTVASSEIAGPRYGRMRAACANLTGTIPKTTLQWMEAIRLRLEFRLDHLWLLIEPTIWIDDSGGKPMCDDAKAFVRERLAARYNTYWNQLLDGWVDLLVGDAESVELRAFSGASGVDAAFTIAKTTAFSWRGGVR